MRTFVKLISCAVFLLVAFNSGDAQSQSTATEKIPIDKSYEIGLELQAYPTGIIPGIRLEKYINARSSINLRLGYQIIDHRDLGVHDNEEGSGYGASIAYRRFFSSSNKGLSLALRTDLWFNEIDWQDELSSGTSNITVVQPTLMAEYSFRPNPKISITPSLSFGWEWNVSTDGEPTGEGAIVLVGCTFGIDI